MRHISARAASQGGFTLIELMIVVAVMALIAFVALPSYQDTVRKSRRADAMNALLRLQQSQERYRGQNPTYASAVASMPTTPSRSGEGYYDLTVDNANAAGYTMSATANSASAQFGDSKCRSLSVTMTSGTITTSSKNAAGDIDSANVNRCWAK